MDFDVEELGPDEFTAAFDKIKKIITYQGNDLVYLHLYPTDYSIFWVNRVKPAVFVSFFELQYKTIHSRISSFPFSPNVLFGHVPSPLTWTVSTGKECLEKKSSDLSYETIEDFSADTHISENEISFLRIDTSYMDAWADFKIDSIHSSFKETLAGITSQYNLHREISVLFKDTSTVPIDTGILSDLLKKELSPFKEI